MVHPVTRFTEIGANGLRKAAYLRLRRLWHFTNALELYEIGQNTQYAINIYGEYRREPRFLMASSLYHPDTATASLVHDGSGPVPGLKGDNHSWDVRPHKHRIQEVNVNVLNIWKSVVELPETPAIETRMVFLPNTVNARILERLAAKPRIRELGWQSSRGWDESIDRRNGYFDVGWSRPGSWDAAILQGPHFNVATPFAKNPRSTMKGPSDYDEIDLEALPADFIPHTNFQPNLNADYGNGYTRWISSGIMKSARDFYRIAWRRQAKTTDIRTLIPIIIPPGTAHVDNIVSVGPITDPHELLMYTGLLSSLPYDFAIRINGASKVSLSLVAQLPQAKGPEILLTHLSDRAARLVCLTEAYRELWESVHPSQWSVSSPARSAEDRRKLLIDFDVLASMLLNMELEELITLYRTQFPILRNFERKDIYDVNGRQIPPTMASKYRKHGEDLPLEERRWIHPQFEIEYIFEFAFRTLDREQDYRDAWAKFEKELGVVGNS